MPKIRIFDTPWHIGHQYEQLKFPWAKWSWLFNYLRPYSNSARGDLTHLFDWVTEYEAGKYDVAILHLDQQCIEPGIWEAGKGSMYRHLNEVIKDIPKIVIMHGTPYAPDVFPDPKVMIDRIKELVGDNYFVVNSHTAQKQWGFGKAIIHGMDPKEWWDLPKEPRVITMISPSGMPMYYDRQFLQFVKEGLSERDIEHCHITVDLDCKNFEDYREFIGRSLIYFNPTRESPMPRSRTEAMLSGACVITTPGQDASDFIRDGENGFLVNRNPEEVIRLVESLISNYDLAVAIGQEGKKTAQELFNWDRYQKEWFDFINFVIKDWHEKRKA